MYLKFLMKIWHITLIGQMNFHWPDDQTNDRFKIYTKIGPENYLPFPKHAYGPIRSTDGWKSGVLMCWCFILELCIKCIAVSRGLVRWSQMAYLKYKQKIGSDYNSHLPKHASGTIHSTAGWKSEVLMIWCFILVLCIKFIFVSRGLVRLPNWWQN